MSRLLVSTAFVLLAGGASATQNVSLGWDVNSQSDLAGYRVYSGISSGVYTAGWDVGNTTMVTIPGFTEAIQYFFVITAYDTEGFESSPSAEISYVVPTSSPTPTPTPTATPTLTPTPTPTPTLTPTPTPTSSPTADLMLTIADGTATVSSGASNIYTIIVTNGGPSEVAGAVIRDIFPNILTGVNFTATQSGAVSGFTASGSGNINDVVTMPAWSKITYKAKGTISSSATGAVSDTATVTAPAGVIDPNLINNSASDSDTLSLKADVRIRITDANTTVSPGASNIYTIVVTNYGPSDVTGAVVRDNFPSALNGVTFTATQSGGAVGFTANGSGDINDVVTMPSDSNITYKAKGTINLTATGTLADTATVTVPSGVTESDLTNNSATDTDTLKLEADLKITVADGGTAASPGANIIYTIGVMNCGPGRVTGAVVRDNFPSAFTGVTFTATQSGGALGFTSSGSGDINDVVTMPSGSKITYKANGTINSSAAGTLSDTATVTAPAGVTDSNLSSNSATDSDTLNVKADLHIRVNDAKAAVSPGASNTYTIVVTNYGPSDVTGAVVKDSFPGAFAGVTYTASQSGGASGFTPSGSGNINDVVTMRSGSELTYQATGIISSSASGTLSDTATVTVSSGVTDSDLTDNSSTDTDTFK